jgi:hypothetical protein
MKKLIFLLIALFFLNIARGQNRFQKYYGNICCDECCSTVQAGLISYDGGYLMAGWINLNPGRNWLYLVKTDAGGNLQWTRKYGGSGDMQATDMIKTYEGGYAIVGWRDNEDFYTDFYFSKIDVSGNIILNRSYDFGSSQMAWTIKQTSDSGFIMVGEGLGVIAVRIDATGNLLWCKTYGQVNYGGFGKSVVQTPDGGFLIGGQTATPQLVNAMYFIRTNAAGDTLWTKTWEPTDSEGAKDMMVTADSGFIIVSATTYPDGDIMVMRTDSVLDTLWVKQYMHPGFSDYPHRINRTGDGGYIIAGTARVSTFSDRDAMVIKIDSTGNYQWGKMYGAAGNAGQENAISVEQAADGGFFIGCARDGYSTGYFTNNYLIKTDAQGGSGCFENRLEIGVTSPSLIKRTTRSVVHSYNLNVTNPTPVDWAGGIEYDICSSTVSISEHELPSPLNIYPNPAVNHFSIQSSIKNGLVEIYNVLGEKIYFEQLKSDPIFLDQPAGIYLVRMNDNKKVWTQKVVIE